MAPFEVCRKEEGQKGGGMKGGGEEGRKGEREEGRKGGRKGEREEHCEEENFVLIVVLKEKIFWYPHSQVFPACKRKPDCKQ